VPRNGYVPHSTPGAGSPVRRPTVYHREPNFNRRTEPLVELEDFSILSDRRERQFLQPLQPWLPNPYLCPASRRFRSRKSQGAPRCCRFFDACTRIRPWIEEKEGWLCGAITQTGPPRTLAFLTAAFGAKKQNARTVNNFSSPISSATLRLGCV
jgi:hypothetical protein